MSKKEFIIRFALFLTFALLFPITYITVRCKLYRQTTTLSFWFLLLIIIVVIVTMVLIKYYLDGMKTKYSFFKQILSGTIKVLVPLAIVLFGAVWFKGKAEWIVEHTNLFIEVIGVILASEVVAIVVNPLPKWAFDNNVDGLVEITDKILHKDGGGE